MTGYLRGFSPKAWALVGCSALLLTLVGLQACSSNGNGNGSSGPCGNGTIDSGEMCDFGIAPGEQGACPGYDNCEDNNPCTADILLQPGTCLARCSHRMRASCSTCGDGTVQAGEKCDTAIAEGLPGACPTACNDRISCTTDQLQGSACTAECVFTQITAIGPVDGCCPSGATNPTDSDCSASCGNGIVEAGEMCDTGIASGTGSCPASCEDNNPCTPNTLISQGTCMARCSFVPAITGPIDGDGCCPAGANNANDDDCTPMCGNGVKETGEKCDRTATNADACPTQAVCNGRNPCARLQGDANTCQAECVTASACAGGDGCCPASCNMNNDNDCGVVCGNGAVESGETCDRTIAAGMTGACPTQAVCNALSPCRRLQGDANTCHAECVVAGSCASGDGCCPAGCAFMTDNDCLCGNGTRDAGEACDTGIAPGTTNGCPIAATCNDSNPCTIDTLNAGGTCLANCTHTTITAVGPMDSCCPAGAMFPADPDCMNPCGNGVVDSGELCDTAINSPAVGFCQTPTTCNDMNACTTDTVTAPGTCQAACTHTNLGCANGDSCCPAACTPANDDDCKCGNGVLDAGENCDTTIPSGMAGSCDCNDGMDCTADTPVGTGCQRTCTNPPITVCMAGDNCCPATCTMANDTDC